MGILWQTTSTSLCHLCLSKQSLPFPVLGPGAGVSQPQQVCPSPSRCAVAQAVAGCNLGVSPQALGGGSWAAWCRLMKACTEDSRCWCRLDASPAATLCLLDKHPMSPVSVLAGPHCTATSAIILYSFFKTSFDQFIDQQCRHY